MSRHLSNVLKRSKDLVNVSGASLVALSGYDPITFFAKDDTPAKPLNGSYETTSEHRGAVYYFTSDANKELFEANPDKYAPQTGGFCTFGASEGLLFPVDIATGHVYKDKLYVLLNPDVKQMFLEDLDTVIAKAGETWPGLVEKHGA
mmetsp:Transcript_16002/g.39195  ORF Transcript_16002/g.39195 Transcript_16002/m.39195 type:complete len:147 (-) Transcript_16002:164-604(-)|eukprot:CAMPEP_0113606120 /NCGR_PEP_ID=MMETSP0017_2-20120614/2687_1 /TAXON_ID=2856 /ORGANISM="Cylindrotheca closterium" /LENGTH=146 /DNA_ID=CAMNT_0000514647 /DNA_START=128 /DNA_END=568 /DNA_ORIENTATION=- /assembly_acc=CAM_ASM_000147